MVSNVSQCRDGEEGGARPYAPLRLCSFPLVSLSRRHSAVRCQARRRAWEIDEATREVHKRVGRRSGCDATSHDLIRPSTPCNRSDEFVSFVNPVMQVFAAAHTVKTWSDKNEADTRRCCTQDIHRNEGVCWMQSGNTMKALVPLLVCQRARLSIIPVWADSQDAGTISPRRQLSRQIFHNGIESLSRLGA